MLHSMMHYVAFVEKFCRFAVELLVSSSVRTICVHLSGVT